MDPAKMLELASELSKKFERLADLRTKAKAEGRDLSRRERAEVEAIKKEAEQLRERMPQVDPRALQWNARTTRGETDKADTLTREQRVTDWLRERGDYRGGGFDRNEGENLSLGKMVRGAVTGNWRDAELEQRAMSESVLANGGYALAPELSSRVIDRVRNQMQVMKAGAITVPMETQQMYLARLAGAAGASWKAEGQPIVDSTPTFERVVLTAKTLPVLVKISVELFEDLSVGATETIEREISSALSLELDRACLRGSGVDPEPTGIRNQSGVTITSLGASGATPSWDNVIDAVSTVRSANIEPNAILWASRTQQTFDKFKDLQNRYLEAPASLAEIPRLVTNQIPTNLTAGANTDASEIYVGRWSDVLVGMRTDLRFQVRLLDERFIDNLQYGLLVHLRADVALAHPTAFNVVTGVRA
jgi:HK97 family phage major capsid protein